MPPPPAFGAVLLFTWLKLSVSWLVGPGEPMKFPVAMPPPDGAASEVVRHPGEVERGVALGVHDAATATVEVAGPWTAVVRHHAAVEGERGCARTEGAAGDAATGGDGGVARHHALIQRDRAAGVEDRPAEVRGRSTGESHVAKRQIAARAVDLKDADRARPSDGGAVAEHRDRSDDHRQAVLAVDRRRERVGASRGEADRAPTAPVGRVDRGNESRRAARTWHERRWCGTGRRDWDDRKAESGGSGPHCHLQKRGCPHGLPPDRYPEMYPLVPCHLGGRPPWLLRWQCFQTAVGSAWEIERSGQPALMKGAGAKFGAETKRVGARGPN